LHGGLRFQSPTSPALLREPFPILRIDQQRSYTAKRSQIEECAVIRNRPVTEEPSKQRKRMIPNVGLTNDSCRFRASAALQLGRPAFASLGLTGVGWHTFRHTVGTMLAEMGEHQLTIRDCLRHNNLYVTNKYLQATAESKRLAQDKLVGAILPMGLLLGKQIENGPLGQEAA